jgi:hypothetical protein
MYVTIDRVSGGVRDRDGSEWGVYEAELAADGFCGNATGDPLYVAGTGDRGHAAAINAAGDYGDYIPPVDS